MTTTSLGGKVIAKLEIKLNQSTDARPGGPPPYPRTAKAFPSQRGVAASGAARRPRHRGPAAKAKSRARAAAYQAAKAAVQESDSTPAPPGSGGSPSPSTPAPNAPLEDSKPLNILPSPPASDGQRLVVSVGRGERRLTSFSQLDGQDDATSPSRPSADPSYAFKAMSARSLYKISSSGEIWAANPT